MLSTATATAPKSKMKKLAAEDKVREREREREKEREGGGGYRARLLPHGLLHVVPALFVLACASLCVRREGTGGTVHVSAMGCITPWHDT